MKILVACEFSGRVRDAFKAKGHNAISCDLLETERPSKDHHIGDVLSILDQDWDMLIAFPPCTYLTKAGTMYWKGNENKQKEALQFIRTLLESKIPKICLENPVGIISTRIKKPTQIINPWQFGHVEKKATCLWLIGLSHLIPTNIIPEEQRKSFVNNLYRDKDRWRHRSRTFLGIAEAMANQWG